MRCIVGRLDTLFRLSLCDPCHLSKPPREPSPAAAARDRLAGSRDGDLADPGPVAERYVTALLPVTPVTPPL